MKITMKERLANPRRFVAVEVDLRGWRYAGTRAELIAVGLIEAEAFPAGPRWQGGDNADAGPGDWDCIWSKGDGEFTLQVNFTEAEREEYIRRVQWDPLEAGRRRHAELAQARQQRAEMVVAAAAADTAFQTFLAAVVRPGPAAPRGRKPRATKG